LLAVFTGPYTYDDWAR